jgi:(Z)-2-((N-methylformamido)methylene)-5-hydroxybutyrolactone dehydrogenase
MYNGGRFVEALGVKRGNQWIHTRASRGRSSRMARSRTSTRRSGDPVWMGMGQMAGFDRARLMRRFADLIADNAERPARVEVHDSGKTYREMIGQTW